VESRRKSIGDEQFVTIDPMDEKRLGGQMSPVRRERVGPRYGSECRNRSEPLSPDTGGSR